MKTITEVRADFWESHPQYQAQRRTRKRQNDYPVDIRMAFCDQRRTPAKGWTDNRGPSF